MIVVIKTSTPEQEINRIRQELQDTWQVTTEKSVGRHKIILGLIGDTATLDPMQIQNVSPWIEQVLRVEQPFKRVSREFRHGQPSEVAVSTPS
ncbi:MAG TPA: 3-deoxy-7-phosphoheptulonate synthase, partial [Cyanobacteria bacterium UBA11368]|nr:3-deoxy-7-phosphoheptulonate synthase [Cyanobacteria bacterium UBA11368]